MVGPSLALVVGLGAGCNGNDGNAASVDGSGDGTGFGSEDDGSAGTDDADDTGPGGDACGDVVCGDNEVCDPETSECVCASGTHACDGVCVDSSSVDHCGDACSPCGGVDNGTPACVAGACVVQCSAGFEACDAGCCPSDVGTVWSGNGEGASIAIDDANAPHVSFIGDDVTLMYAHLGPSGWEAEAIGGQGTQQRPTAIALDADGEPVVAYRGNWAIQVARRDGDTWTHEPVYESAAGYGPVVGPRGLAVDSTGAPHVVAEQRSETGGNSNSDIWHMWWDGGQWQRESVTEAFDNRFSLPSIAIDSEDRLHVAWTSYFDDGLNYATKGTDGWTPILAVDNSACCDDAHIALGPASAPFVAYEARDLGYTVADGSAPPWTFAPMHDAMTLVGDLAFDSAGGLVYSLGAGEGDIVVGRANGAGFDESVVASDALSFMMALDGNDAAQFVFSTDGALNYAVQPAP